MHTKGPWTIEPGGERLIHTKALVVSAGDGLGPVAFVTRDNAPLVVAAPDMYAALAYAVDNPEFDSAEFDRLVHAALKKARERLEPAAAK